MRFGVKGARGFYRVYGVWGVEGLGFRVEMLESREPSLGGQL